MKLFQNDVNIFINTTSEQVNNMELNGAYDILTPWSKVWADEPILPESLLFTTHRN